jgi:hypothetical protein
MCWCTDIMFFQTPPYKASRQLLIPRIAAAGTSISPLLCQAWRGYNVTSAHRVEVEVGAGGRCDPLASLTTGGGVRVDTADHTVEPCRRVPYGRLLTQT